MSLSILVRENSAVNLSMATIARLLLETVRSDQTEHNNNHPIKSQAVDIVEAPGEEGRVGGGVVCGRGAALWTSWANRDKSQKRNAS